ncbi:MAG TPA: helix-turn-helix transcriptional regulator [Candidatus Udaeobacter sp.]|nr:helix-turn-helix transcriptional regulator [Candidatus Udaeobacter sp.]
MSPSLSRREIEVLTHVALGETSKEIAGALGIGERTVNWHLERVFLKLGAGAGPRRSRSRSSWESCADPMTRRPALDAEGDSPLAEMAEIATKIRTAYDA